MRFNDPTATHARLRERPYRGTDGGGVEELTTNIDILSYESTHQFAYGEFANAVRSLLKKAIDETKAVPRQQSTKARAKSVTSLRQKLTERGIISSVEIENEIKDLAGVRLIFYTDSDVNAFLQTGLIPTLFEVHWDETRIHHPTDENQLQRYQGIHYTVSLKEPELSQPKYQTFTGMRCEVQIQTVLNHAWAEIYHDMIYKRRGSKGFGTAKVQALDRRMKRIMDDYLRPAGYELQKAQADHRRLLEGKALFDRDAFNLLASCKSNNERDEILTSINDDLIPNFDDLSAVYPDLREAVLASVEAARRTATVPYEFAGGTIEGRTVGDVTATAIKILDGLRYVNIGLTLKSWVQLYQGTDDAEIHGKLIQATKRLAKFDLAVWKKVGPGVQGMLGEELAADTAIPRALAMAIADELLGTTLEGTQFAARAATIRTAAIPAIESVKRIRSTVLGVLAQRFDESSSDEERRGALATMREATVLPSQAVYSNELCRLVLEDTKFIVEFYAARAEHFSHELLQYIEHRLLFDYRRAQDLVVDVENRFGCQDIAAQVVAAIRSLRDVINRDEGFVRYKTLVGHESVFPFEWDDDGIDYQKRNTYRLEQVERYVESISEDNSDQWYELAKRCAATKSNDAATFPAFAAFLKSLSQTKPKVAIALFDRGDPDIATFLAAHLNGLVISGAPNLYSDVVRKHLDQARNLGSIVRHARSLGESGAGTVIEVLERAISLDDALVVRACVPYAVENYAKRKALAEEIFVPALRYLNRCKDPHWLHDTWFLSEAGPFFRGLSGDQADLVRSGLILLDRLDNHVETILKALAHQYPRSVWQFLRDRFKREGDDYEPIPFKFYDLREVLARDVELAVSVMKAWHDEGDNDLFQFSGGRLLHAVFPEFTEALGIKLANVVTDNPSRNAKFVVSVLRNYEGDTFTHLAIKELVEGLPQDHPQFNAVDNLLESTGVVSGEFGFVEAFRAKKTELTLWLADDRKKVREFAERYLAKIDQKIAAEQRSADASARLHELDYEDDVDK
ncbi:MAG: GTP pyrophosphokinase family protein [Micropepsaceae bacterium]